MMINGLLAGLVAITAPSGWVSPYYSVLIGGIAGVLVVLSVAFFDRVLKIDDPVGAISVHGVNGMWGQLALGLFADGSANYGGLQAKGLFFGDAGQFGAQCIGAVVAFVWAFGVAWIFFKALDMIMGLRSKPEDEIAGLDIPEMGLLAYSPDAEPYRGTGGDYLSRAGTPHRRQTMKKIEAIIRPERVSVVRKALEETGYPGITITDVRGHGAQKGSVQHYRGTEFVVDILHKVKLELVVGDDAVDKIVKVIIENGAHAATLATARYSSPRSTRLCGCAPGSPARGDLTTPRIAPRRGQQWPRRCMSALPVGNWPVIVRLAFGNKTVTRAYIRSNAWIHTRTCSRSLRLSSLAGSWRASLASASASRRQSARSRLGLLIGPAMFGFVHYDGSMVDLADDRRHRPDVHRRPGDRHRDDEEGDGPGLCRGDRRRHPPVYRRPG